MHSLNELLLFRIAITLFIASSLPPNSSFRYLKRSFKLNAFRKSDNLFFSIASLIVGCNASFGGSLTVSFRGASVPIWARNDGTSGEAGLTGLTGRATGASIVLVCGFAGVSGGVGLTGRATGVSVGKGLV